MPQAVAHILFPLLLMSFVRDALTKNEKKSFPLHYVLIAGMAGILPDLDVAAFWFLHFFGFTYFEVHKTFSHALFLPVILFALFFAFRSLKASGLGKYKLQLSVIMLMISFGIFTHLLLDLIAGESSLFYPASDFSFGFALFSFLPSTLSGLAAPTLDAALLVIYLTYLEIRHKITDFI